MQEKIKELFSAWEDNTPGGQILIKQGEDVLYEGNFGLANLEHKLTVTVDTSFHVASVSKQFTVMAVLLLWERGLLDIDCDIKEYVGDLLSIKEKITIRQLMNNVSGLKDQWEILGLRGIRINDSIDTNDLLITIKQVKDLNFEPGEQYMYSNSGFTLLTEIVERITGVSLPTFVEEEIFQKLGMNKTKIRKSYTEIIPNSAQSYFAEGNDYYYNPLNYELYGATSVNTTARDLMKMLDEYLEPKHIPGKVLDEMKKPAVFNSGEISNYCGGLMVEEVEGRVIYGHGGSDAGYRSQFYFVPEENLKIIILSNTNYYMLAEKGRELIRLVLGVEAVKERVEYKINGDLKEGYYYTPLEEDPLLIKLVEEDDVLKQGRKYTNCELINYQIGNLPEYLYPVEDGLIYRTGNSDTKLKFYEKAGQLALSGYYYIPDAKVFVEFYRKDNDLYINHPRYGESLVLEFSDTSGMLSFEVKTTEHIYYENGSWYLKGERTRNTELVKVNGEVSELLNK